MRRNGYHVAGTTVVTASINYTYCTVPSCNLEKRKYVKFSQNNEVQVGTEILNRIWATNVIQIVQIHSSTLVSQFIVRFAGIWFVGTYDIVQCSGSLIASDHHFYRITPLKTPFGLVIPFITIPIARKYIHSQLFLTLLLMYTVYNHLYVRNYNH
jgi:hypothetical protein